MQRRAWALPVEAAGPRQRLVGEHEVEGLVQLVEALDPVQAGADDPDTDEVFASYLRAKGAAEDDLRRRDLDWTILRPGRLTDLPGAGLVELGDSVPYGEISRDDVAAMIAELLETGRGVGRTLELVAGESPVEDAVAAQ